MTGETPVLEKFEDASDELGYRFERKRLSENNYNRAQSLAAWLLATLVATNGAAVVTLIGNAALVQQIGAEPVIVFLMGVFAAMLSGVGSWLEAQSRSGLHYWQSRPAGGMSAGAQQALRKLQIASTWYRRLARTANVASLGAFGLGCWLAVSRY